MPDDQLSAEMRLLLTVEDHFLIEGRGLVVVPLLDPPVGQRKFRAFSDPVRVCHPDKTTHTYSARFDLAHFRMLDGTGRWNITVLIPSATKEDVPIGSAILVTEETFKKAKGLAGD